MGGAKPLNQPLPKEHGRRIEVQGALAANGATRQAGQQTNEHGPVRTLRVYDHSD